MSDHAGTDVERVPFVDLGWQHRHVEEEVAAGFARVLANTSYIDGPDVAAFEADFATYCGTRRAVGVANGTEAIELVLRGLGIGAGDEVVIPANTFIATAEAVVRAGANPVLVDCDENALIDPKLVPAALGANTRAIIPVHLYGQMAPMAPLVELAAERGLAVIEDAAQAQGATQDGRGIGALGFAAATSFYPGKNLGAYGDAGGVVTDDDNLADRIRSIRNHGSSRRYEHDELGVNSRLDTLQAVVLRAKLRHLDVWNELRRVAADRYRDLLGGIDGVRLPATLPGNQHVWHLYVIRVDRRDEVLAELQARGIGAAIHYPKPVHLHGAFADLKAGPGSYPVAERTAGEILSLPMFPGITEQQQSRVAEALAAIVG